ncbi:MAG: hypothetical protein AMS20_16465 [Gemmatimonas sp. SG8_28]|nr:MAG: hypothetical protein AMS20_16465 [Gemmatimonas sp. SG8_28]
MSIPSPCNRRPAALDSAATRSMLHTWCASLARIAAWYPDPVPTSSTRARRVSRASWVIRATMYGCEMVWSYPIGRGPSS